MRTLNLRLIGTTPILLHQISRHQEREKIASHVEAGKSLLDEAWEKMSKDSDGNPVISVSWIVDAIRVGCSRITVEGKQISFTKLQSVMHFPMVALALRRKNGSIPECDEVYQNMQHATPRSRKSIVVVAPMFRDWMSELSVTISGNLFPDDVIGSDKILDQIFVEAGRSGIGLFHPPKKHFGQFRVQSFEA
jgi:hypothetical protein